MSDYDLITKNHISMICWSLGRGGGISYQNLIAMMLEIHLKKKNSFIVFVFFHQLYDTSYTFFFSNCYACKL